MRYILVALALMPIGASAPNVLTESRDITYKCQEGVCFLLEKDWEYMLKRDRLFTEILPELSAQAKKCNFRGV
jgi:hypothetical protein